MAYTEENKDRRVVQIRKGLLELAAMAALYRTRHYGYSLIKALSTGEGPPLKEGTIYPILARLDRDGLVASEWVESEHGPPRKYYTLTGDGQALFEELRGEFNHLALLIRDAAAETAGPQLVGLPIRKAQ
ncbi:MAG: PadR family transcriptional regulator [Acidobacteria bacterium]|nr:PadR family transcriptional regulator [Acidobacteriota bacterium]